MSRSYNLTVQTKHTTLKQLRKVIVDKFGWGMDYIDNTEFNGSGYLCGGCTEEEAHEQISDAIKKLCPEAKVKTIFTNTDELPCEEYGDDID